MKLLILLGASGLLLGTPAPGDEISTRTSVAGKPKQSYFLIDPSADEETATDRRLLLVLPGGNGSADFNPFVTNIARNALEPGFLVAQMVAVKWTPDQRVVWPTKESPVEGMEFTTGEFIEAVIEDVGKRHAIDRDHIYTLSWSSSGPAAYAASLRIDAIRGSFIAMSVFKPDQLPPLAEAKGHRYFLHHSPEDRVCPMRMARDAEKKLAEQGAEVEFASYDGGHGWHGDVFGAIRRGIAWLQE